jgi:hypothetical protein
MMRLMLVAGSAIAVLTTGAMAAETCVPVPPASWTGELQVSGGFLTSSVFEKNGCSYRGADQVNGTDGLVFDVSGHGGLTLNVTTNDSGPLGKGVQGFFLNENCERGGFWGFTQNKTPYPAPVPESAKWLLAYSDHGASTVSVAVESAGRTCEATPPPVKKKKKKRR